MGGHQAANVMSTIKKDQANHEGKSISDDEIEMIRKPILNKYEKEGNPFYSSARLWDDGVISPLETREKLIQALQSIQHKPIADTHFPVFRM